MRWPDWLFPPTRSRSRRLVALLVFHNEIDFLPDYFRNVAPQVDGIVALDDGSTDGSGEFVATQSSLLELIRIPPRTPHHWDEPRNKRTVIAAAARFRPEWLIAVDADERLEKDFRARALEEIDRAEREGVPALSVHFRELWDSPTRFRSDGIWGAKRQARLFRYRRDAELDPKPLHGHWAPLNSKSGGGFPPADLYLYHLRMIDAAKRHARRLRYEKLDPDNRFQSVGYTYLTDETNIELSPLLEGREYEPLP